MQSPISPFNTVKIIRYVIPPLKLLVISYCVWQYARCLADGRVQGLFAPTALLCFLVAAIVVLPFLKRH